MNRTLFIVALSMCLLFACKTDTKNSSANNSGEPTLFDAYFELFPQASFAHPGGLNLEREAFMLYNANHLDKSADAFMALYESHHFPRHKYYAAISNLGAGRNDLAITQLEELDSSGKLSMKFVHQYYLGLAYIKAGRQADAKEKLGQLKGNFQYYKKKADALIEQL